MNDMPVPAFAHDIFGWMVIVAGTIATIGTIVFAIAWVIHPGERDPYHPKYLVLKDDR
jgi:hypothetical protein